MGHEIGYHYEDLTLANGDLDKAYDSFCRNLQKFRKLYPVKTICMHGSPRSPYDSKDIWKKYDYKALGITTEPYFDIDFDKLPDKLMITFHPQRWTNKPGAWVRELVWQGVKNVGKRLLVGV